MRQVFSDGNMADVVRIGDTIHKQRGPWWDATRQTLTHLEAVNYPWSPRILAESDDTVQLTFIPGDTIDAGLTTHNDDEFLVIIGQRVRELHTALDGFRLLPGTTSVPWTPAPSDATMLCHNDLSPWNTVVREGAFAGLIDWDLVSYGTAEWELAWVCWRFAPLYPTGDRIPFSAQRQAERCATILSAYGPERLRLGTFLDVMDARMACGVDTVEILGAAGVPGFDRILSTGMHLSAIDDRRWMSEHRTTLENVISAL